MSSTDDSPSPADVPTPAEPSPASESVSESAKEPSEPTHVHSAEQDFEAALHEIVSNLDVRRLMIVVANVLVPASTVATVQRSLRDLAPRTGCVAPAQRALDCLAAY